LSRASLDDHIPRDKSDLDRIMLDEPVPNLNRYRNVVR